jgi:hypothetical protein
MESQSATTVRDDLGLLLNTIGPPSMRNLEERLS